jgi:hypothetical protein
MGGYAHAIALPRVVYYQAQFRMGVFVLLSLRHVGLYLHKATNDILRVLGTFWYKNQFVLFLVEYCQHAILLQQGRVVV